MFIKTTLKPFSSVLLLSFRRHLSSEVRNRLFAAKQVSGLSFAELARRLDQNEVWFVACLLGEQPFESSVAENTLRLLRLSDDPKANQMLAEMQTLPEIRGKEGNRLLANRDPFLSRFHELLCVYGPALRHVTNEMCGNGILSAIDCSVNCRPKDNGKRVVIEIDSKFLEFKPFVKQ
ncbi:cyanate hydratase-like [Oppia nitens]|uniref:cyanate hydratase-like n=1 Tax=Oppia nitens TaxID=1686743 RepID=UPI0023DC57A9|nr:cyanate hydratase-like [Oppia nitens]